MSSVKEVYVLRSLQLNAIELDKQVLEILKTQVSNTAKYINVGVVGNYLPEIDALLKLILWKIPHILDWTEKVVKVASFVNLLVFMLHGRYPTLVDRLLSHRIVSSGGSRNPDYQFTSRELVWHSLNLEASSWDLNSTGRATATVSDDRANICG
uniref:RING-type E3 ubiquitin transferase (cysteine targeting) n=1 Tax=Timema genevievae TaxID=629358 RepID=A0A7R9PHN6_TIMGE|nr:unnamed protein product [Timema genevievae]